MDIGCTIRGRMPSPYRLRDLSRRVKRMSRGTIPERQKRPEDSREEMIARERDS